MRSCLCFLLHGVAADDDATAAVGAGRAAGLQRLCVVAWAKLTQLQLAACELTHQVLDLLAAASSIWFCVLLQLHINRGRIWHLIFQDYKHVPDILNSEYVFVIWHGIMLLTPPSYCAAAVACRACCHWLMLPA